MSGAWYGTVYTQHACMRCHTYRHTSNIHHLIIVRDRKIPKFQTICIGMAGKGAVFLSSLCMCVGRSQSQICGSCGVSQSLLFAPGFLNAATIFFWKRGFKGERGHKISCSMFTSVFRSSSSIKTLEISISSATCCIICMYIYVCVCINN